MKASSWCGGRSPLVSMALCAVLLPACTTMPVTRGDIAIDGKGVHPESVTSSSDGSLYVGSITGTIYRAGPRDSTATAFIVPSAANGLRATFGVLVDSKQQRLWVCSVANPFGPRSAAPAPSEVVAFELRSGQLIGRWPFPAPGGTCNDIAIDKSGAAYATDTPGGRILRLAKGGTALEVVASDERLKGIDGIAFAEDGAMYINNVQGNQLWRVRVNAAGEPATLTLLNASRQMAGPDGLRPIGGNRFLQAEGTSGRITLVTIEGDDARIDVLREGLNSSPGVTLVGRTVYAVEGKIQYLVNPELRGQDPGPFKAIAIPLPKLMPTR
jgi:sugar lactone lactonase YvrE